MYTNVSGGRGVSRPDAGLRTPSYQITIGTHKSAFTAPPRDCLTRYLTSLGFPVWNDAKEMLVFCASVALGNQPKQEPPDKQKSKHVCV